MGSTLLMALVLMQYVVSVKAGLVNHVHGVTNVAEMEQVLRGGSIRTFPGGYAEVLLTPGSFLRIGENSAVVLDGVELESVSLRVVKGPALIEVIEINRKFPIRVTTGDLTMNIVKAGLYRFDNGVATVLDGRLQTLDAKLAYEKGWQVFMRDTYRARKTGEVPHDGLDEYSQTRSEINARANMALAASTRGPVPDSPFWVYSTAQGFYTYLPDGNHRSPYGFQYYRAGYVAVRPSPSGYSSGSTNSSPVVSSGGNSGNSGGGDGGGGGGGGVTVSTPAGSPSTPAGYIGGKGGTTGATQ